jgi:hypothetical protein
MPGAARESRLRVDGEDGCGASDEREGNSGKSEKLPHGVFPSVNGLYTSGCHRPPKWSVTDSTKRTHLAGTCVPMGVPPHVASVAVQSGGKRRSGTTRLKLRLSVTLTGVSKRAPRHVVNARRSLVLQARQPMRV